MCITSSATASVGHDHSGRTLGRQVAQLEADAGAQVFAAALERDRSWSVTTIGTGQRSSAPSIHGEWNSRSGGGRGVSTSSTSPFSRSASSRQRT